MRRGTEIHVVNGEDVARRQLSQWQCKVQFGVPSYRNVIEPHRHLPSTAFKSCALPAPMEVATLPLARILCQWQTVRHGSGWPNSTAVLFSGRRDIGTQGRWSRQLGERCLWWWDQAVWARMPSFAQHARASYPVASSFRAAGSLRRMIGVRITFP